MPTTTELIDLVKTYVERNGFGHNQLAAIAAIETLRLQLARVEAERNVLASKVRSFCFKSNAASAGDHESEGE